MALPCLSRLCDKDCKLHSNCSECCDVDVESNIHSEATTEVDIDVLGQHVHLRK